jgi:tRNA threonylcarbamoyladenosine biosynthesis protein TsaE
MNSVIEVPVDHLNELPVLSKMLFDFAPGIRVFLVNGPMGAGKTTFIKAACSTLGSTDHFSSPTYSIVNEYSYPRGRIFHMDLYRLGSIEELLDAGIEEHIRSGDYCFIEWPEKAEGFIPENHVKIDMEMRGNNRYLRLTKF